ncbi:MAG TPA: dihydrolipoamide acetyltransferase family protein [Streptosporangiaceae bacterium]|jgi:2-oxoisovalerate dehydrogenase E2 component (dihydrolipoyl transacylase)|nr:dihydrolipoamide acetyltransferase family protein [Streptosporangiaceae bacterium]
MSDLKEFKLPDVGEGLTEADIIRWHVHPGDQVTVNQIIVEIETAKAVVELPSPYAGVVADLLVPEGATADVGTPIISVNVGGSPAGPGEREIAEAADLVPLAAVELASEPGMIGSPAPKAERQAVLVGYGVKLGTTARRTRKAASAAPAREAAAPQAASAPAPVAPPAPSVNGDGARALAKPPVRKMARDLGVDLAVLAGTGPGGSITRDDVQQAAAGPAPAAAVPVLAAGVREERIPIRGVRKHTAAAVSASAFTAPHVTEFLQIDITETMNATARLRTLPDFADVRVSPLLLVAKALLVAAARHPMINSKWDEAAQEIVVKHYVNLGIAAATDRGLVVPNVKDAQALSLPDLARALAQLAETARAGKATPADMSGGTITITNVGIFGVDTGTPILTPGETAILAFGQVKDAPWVVDGALAVRKVCTLALSFDHRMVDGDLGSAVLRDIGAMLTDPLRMLAWS